MPMHGYSIIVAILISPLMFGCTTTKKEDVLPQDGPTMREIYETHFEKIGRQQAHQVREQLGGRPAVDSVSPGHRLKTHPQRPPSTKLKEETKPNTIHPTANMDADDSDINTPATLDYGGSEINPQERTEMANNTGVVGQEINPPDVDLAAYTRQADNEIQGLFPRLSNPDLVIYVYPHLSGFERVPIPGYATTFPMYNGIEYALPGEVPVP